MDLADKFGIVIVDESPGVALDGFHNKQLLKNHLRVMEELVERDKNRASVLMWSVANEPRSQHDGADTYFSTVATHTKVRPYLCNITTTLFEGLFVHVTSKLTKLSHNNKVPFTLLPSGLKLFTSGFFFTIFKKLKAEKTQG